MAVSANARLVAVEERVYAGGVSGISLIRTRARGEG